MPEKIFFQSSLPRSGSTLLQNIIGQNPDFYTTPTSGVLELVYAARNNYTNSPEFKAQDKEQMKNAFTSFCRGGIENYFNSLTDKRYALDKSRGWGIHYGFLNSFYPEPKIVCMVRDLRDIYASMEKNFRKNQHLDSGIVDHAKMIGTTTEKRIDVWSNSQPVGLAIERLQQIVKEGISSKMLFIRYEDLLSNPQYQLDRIYNYFNVNTYKHDFNNITQITKEDDTIYGIYGDHNIKNSLQENKSNAKEILGIHAYNWIRQNYDWFYKEFKYY
jgi:sulfotransferase